MTGQITAPFIPEDYKRYADDATITQIMDWLEDLAVDETICQRTLEDAIAEFLRHCRLKNLSRERWNTMARI